MKRVILSLSVLLLSIGLKGQVMFYGPVNPSTGGTTAQDFETAFDIYDAQGADDFIVPTGVTWYIDSILLPGSYSAAASMTSGVIVEIYTNNNGLPGTLVFSDTINTDVDGNGDGDLTAHWETPIQLTAGHYWLVANARKDFGNGGGQWYWQRDISVTGLPALWRNPGNGFGSGCTGWTVVYNCAALAIPDSGFAFYIYGCYGPNKPLSSGFDTTLCFGSANNVTLTANTNGSQANVSYLWNTGDTTLSIDVNGSGTYTVYAVDDVTLCGIGAEYNVNIQSVPAPNIANDTICGSESIPGVFGPVSGCVNCVVSWGNGSSGTFYSTFDPGMVTVTVTDTVTGCTSADTAYLEVISADATILPGSIIDVCSGSDVVVSVLEQLISYTWTFSSDGNNWVPAGTGTTTTITTGGSVAVFGMNSAGCMVFDTAIVVLRPSPDPDITFISQANGNVRLTASGGFASYFWSNGSVGQNISVSQNGIYTVTVTDEFGCEGTAFINVFTVGNADPIVSQMNIYPNPANLNVQLEWPQEWVGNATATIMDLQGRTLMLVPATQQLQTLDVSSLSTGQYLVKIQSPEGVGKTSLVITQ